MHKLLGIEELLNNKPELAEVVIFLQVIRNIRPDLCVLHLKDQRVLT